MVTTSVPLSYGGGTNPIKVMDDMDIYVVQNPRLTWDSQFVIFRTDAVTKPFIRQEEKEVVLKVIAEGSEIEYKKNKHSYGVDSRLSNIVKIGIVKEVDYNKAVARVSIDELTTIGCHGL